MATRAQQVRKAVQATRPTRTGGTTAPGGASPSIADRKPLQFNPVGQTQQGLGQGQALPPKPASAPPISKAPAQSALPWDSIATLQAGQAGKGLENRLAGDASQRVLAEQAFGLAPGYDINNPYSQAALLEAQHTYQRRGSVNSAGNNLYSGSTVNHLRQSDRRYGQARFGLEGQRAAKLAEIEADELGGKEAYGEANTDAQVGAIERAEKAPIEPQASAASKASAKKKQPLGKLPFYATPAALKKAKGKK